MRKKPREGTEKSVRGDTETTANVKGGGDIARGAAHRTESAATDIETVHAPEIDGGVMNESVTGVGIVREAASTDVVTTARSLGENASQTRNGLGHDRTQRTAAVDVIREVDHHSRPGEGETRPWVAMLHHGLQNQVQPRITRHPVTTTSPSANRLSTSTSVVISSCSQHLLVRQ